MSLVHLTENVQAHDLPIPIDVQVVDRLKHTIVLVKYGGNAMVDEDAQKSVTADIVRLKDLGIHPVIVHGGGRAIRRLLDEVGVESHFVDGHRQTDAETMRYVEMALTGNVNQKLVRLLNARGLLAVGVSGKDASMVTARKRIHRAPNGKQDQDLGFVGDVAEVNTDVIVTLIESGYVPVVSPVAAGRDGFDYNINADMFAGHLAGALNASRYVVLTDVDGLLANKNDPTSLIRSLAADQARSEIGGIIQGGMIPKIESCLVALKHGAGSAHIANGTCPHSLLKALLTKEHEGTMIRSTEES